MLMQACTWPLALFTQPTSGRRPRVVWDSAFAYNPGANAAAAIRAGGWRAASATRGDAGPAQGRR